MNNTAMNIPPDTPREVPCAELPHALREHALVEQRLAGRRPAVFLDYDGTLTPIVERPEDAVLAADMRAVIRELAARCTVCVVSGRDRMVVQQLMRLDDLVVAGSHGFDIWHPDLGTLDHPAASGFEDLLAGVTERLRRAVEQVPGASVEAKRASVAVHYRRVAAADHGVIRAIVDALLDDYPGRLRVTPGKMVYELQPKTDWHKGKAVLYLLQNLGLDGDGTVPLYLGDDITDEDAFRALSGRGVGIVVAGNPQEADETRTTAADFRLDSVEEVARFLDTLAR